jgi:hypothetical protein
VKLIGDALPPERSWLDSAVVDPRSNRCSFTAVGVDKITTEGSLLWGFMGGHFILFPDNVFWFFFN